MAELEDTRHPGFVFLEPELMLARAWSPPLKARLAKRSAWPTQAARLAADAGQSAHEVLALQTAVGFGDLWRGDRLVTLATEVNGPRAPAAAAYAAALAAADGVELAAASEEFERMGDMVGAADATAHAAISYRSEACVDPRSGARRGQLRSLTNAAVPAPRRFVRQPSVAADRSRREVVMLIAEGLSNREAATRLSVSVRTVENHIYRAMERPTRPAATNSRR